jgi:alcohol dehydrogenase
VSHVKALVYHGPGRKAWEDVADPAVKRPTDVIVKVDTTTICGTDLHILTGDVPAVTDGRILGHEAVGTITEVGPAVENLAVGDRVLLSCISACGRCVFCRHGTYSHCLGDEGTSGIGWIFGHLIDGTQAEFVRVPYAETSVFKLPPSVSNADAVLLSDVLPTGHEIGVQNGHVKPGDVVAVIGVGPVGLAAVMTAQLYGPSRVIAIDTDENRLAQSLGFGATDTVVSDGPDVKQKVMALTDGLGVDVAIEAVGVPATFALALDIVRPAGHVANVGVHCKPVEFPIQDLWIANLTITTGLVNTNTTDDLLKLLVQHKLPVQRFVSHTFSLSDIMAAYDVFSRAVETKALKVVINA